MHTHLKSILGLIILVSATEAAQDDAAQKFKATDSNNSHTWLVQKANALPQKKKLEDWRIELFLSNGIILQEFYEPNLALLLRLLLLCPHRLLALFNNFKKKNGHLDVDGIREELSSLRKRANAFEAGIQLPLPNGCSLYRYILTAPLPTHLGRKPSCLLELYRLGYELWKKSDKSASAVNQILALLGQDGVSPYTLLDGILPAREFGQDGLPACLQNLLYTSGPALPKSDVGAYKRMIEKVAPFPVYLKYEAAVRVLLGLNPEPRPNRSTELDPDCTYLLFGPLLYRHSQKVTYLYCPTLLEGCIPHGPFQSSDPQRLEAVITILNTGVDVSLPDLTGCPDLPGQHPLEYQIQCMNPPEKIDVMIGHVLRKFGHFSYSSAPLTSLYDGEQRLLRYMILLQAIEDKEAYTKAKPSPSSPHYGQDPYIPADKRDEMLTYFESEACQKELEEMLRGKSMAEMYLASYRLDPNAPTTWPEQTQRIYKQIQAEDQWFKDYLPDTIRKLQDRCEFYK